MTGLDEMLESAAPESEWVCRPCPEPDCDQRFVTEAGLVSHRQRTHGGVLVESEA
jgi:hypothetical protein